VKPIVLVGPMGVGKTTLGKKLAKRLELAFIDTDTEIVKLHGSIPAIFEEYGEEHFRRIESETLAKALETPAVISSGGGVVLSSRNRDLLQSANVVYLETDGKHIRSRLEHGSRPLLRNGFEDWKRIYEERKPLYESVANIKIDTSKIGLRQTIDEICERLEQL